MVAQLGSSALFTGKHSYFESPEQPDSSAVKRARISIQEVSPVGATADPDADTVYNTNFEASNEFPPIDISPSAKADSPSLEEPELKDRDSVRHARKDLTDVPRLSLSETEFVKATARRTAQVCTIPQEVFSAIKADPTLGYQRLKAVLHETDPRLWTKSFLNSMPADFFSPFEVQAFQRMDPAKAWHQIKDLNLLRFRATDQAGAIRLHTCSIKLDLVHGLRPYMQEIRQALAVCDTIVGCDITPSTIIRKVISDVPTKIAESLLIGESESDRFLRHIHADLKDLSWFDQLTDEVVGLYEKLTRAGVVFSARKPSAALHAMQSSADSDTGFDESAVRALLKSKDPALHALISDAGYKRTKSKSGTAGKGKSKGKGKGKAKQRRSKSDDKYTGTASDLIAKFKPQYTDDEWCQREKLIQSGVAINLDGNPHASLFVKDRTEDATGRNRFICVKCRRFGHTAPFCDDLKRAQSWKQCSEGSK